MAFGSLCVGLRYKSNEPRCKHYQIFAQNHLAFVADENGACHSGCTVS
jgi:hypothetical protein